MQWQFYWSWRMPLYYRDKTRDEDFHIDNNVLCIGPLQFRWYSKP